MTPNKEAFKFPTILSFFGEFYLHMCEMYVCFFI